VPSCSPQTLTVYDNDTPVKAVPRRSSTDLYRTKAKHQITGRTGE
jgi:hypothetical protein